MIHDQREINIKKSIKTGGASSCVFFGLFIMCIALFLHPMSPENFLGVVLTIPLQTVAYAYGLQTAVLFWVGLVLTTWGLFVFGRIIFFYVGYVLKK